MELLTLDDLKNMTPGKDFASGIVENSPEGIDPRILGT